LSHDSSPGVLGGASLSSNVGQKENMSRIPRTIIFADGENLVFRYQELLASGKKPKKGVSHIVDEFVWSDEITKQVCYDITRVSFYTSATGDDEKIFRLRKAISEVGYDYSYTPDDTVPEATGYIYPVVFNSTLLKMLEGPIRRA
jgi:hypothetical protein